MFEHTLVCLVLAVSTRVDESAVLIGIVKRAKVFFPINQLKELTDFKWVALTDPHRLLVILGTWSLISRLASITLTCTLLLFTVGTACRKLKRSGGWSCARSCASLLNTILFTRTRPRLRAWLPLLKTANRAMLSRIGSCLAPEIYHIASTATVVLNALDLFQTQICSHSGFDLFRWSDLLLISAPESLDRPCTLPLIIYGLLFSTLFDLLLLSLV